MRVKPFLWLVAVWLLWSVSSAWAETIELVTYYPTSANTGDLHVRSITVGTAYTGVDMSANDGVVLIEDRLGIGTNAPAGSLHVVGPDNQLDNILFMPGGGTGTIRMGIGTATPSANLDINGGFLRLRHGVTGTAGGALIEMGDRRPNTGLGLVWNCYWNGTAWIYRNTDFAAVLSLGDGVNQGDLVYWSAPSAAAGTAVPFVQPTFRITNAGNVGIGTSAPAADLQIEKNKVITRLEIQNTGGAGSVQRDAQINFRSTNFNPSAYWSIGTGAAPATTGTTDAFYIYKQAGSVGTKMVIRDNGNVGIGTTAPGGRLGVLDSVQIESAAGLARLGLNSKNDPAGGATWNWYAIGGSHTGGPRIGNLELQDNSGAPVMAICVQRGTGNVGLGVNTPAFTLHVNGSAGKPGGGAWSNSSDVRLKKNIHPMAGALEKMLALHGVTFEWKDPASQGNLTGTQMGMIGQEVEKVFPEWVSEDPAGMKVISVRGFEALTVEAVRELQEENKSLRREVDLRRSENHRLDERVRTLEKKLEEVSER